MSTLLEEARAKVRYKVGRKSTGKYTQDMIDCFLGYLRRDISITQMAKALGVRANPLIPTYSFQIVKKIRYGHYKLVDSVTGEVLVDNPYVEEVFAESAE
jgi:hypothetical protein